jgi:hypothetical protein
MAAAPPNIIGRDEARALGLKRYFTGKPCKHGHVAERGVSNPGCMECSRGRRREWRAANLEKAKERERESARKHRAADPERARGNWRRWRAANKDKINGPGKKASVLRQEQGQNPRSASSQAGRE